MIPQQRYYSKTMLTFIFKGSNKVHGRHE